MDSKFIEKVGEGYHKVYDSIVVDPKHLDILGNKLTQDILKRLSKTNLCAMDVARDLKEHEQKIYYHLRRLEKAGIIKVVGTEKRSGMTAKMYSTVSPIVAAKLYDDGHIVDSLAPHTLDPKMNKFFEPFVKEGLLDAKIIVGDPSPHGKYDKGAKDPMYAADFFLMMGRLLKDFRFPHYKIDIEIRESDLKENLILLGDPKSNTISEKVNEHLPIHFEFEPEFVIKSKVRIKKYNDPRTGIIIKYTNPFNKDKKILLVAGIRSKGMRAAVIALTQHFDKMVFDMDEEGNVFRVVEGLDKDGDGIVDSIRIVE